jgi:hypothetical protein
MLQVFGVELLVGDLRGRRQDMDRSRREWTSNICRVEAEHVLVDACRKSHWTWIERAYFERASLASSASTIAQIAACRRFTSVCSRRFASNRFTSSAATLLARNSATSFVTATSSSF